MDTKEIIHEPLDIDLKSIERQFKERHIKLWSCQDHEVQCELEWSYEGKRVGFGKAEGEYHKHPTAIRGRLTKRLTPISIDMDFGSVPPTPQMVKRATRFAISHLKGAVEHQRTIETDFTMNAALLAAISTNQDNAREVFDQIEYALRVRTGCRLSPLGWTAEEPDKIQWGSTNTYTRGRMFRMPGKRILCDELILRGNDHAKATHENLSIPGKVPDIVISAAIDHPITRLLDLPPEMAAYLASGCTIRGVHNHKGNPDMIRIDLRSRTITPDEIWQMTHDMERAKKDALQKA